MSKSTATTVLAFAAGMLLSGMILPYDTIVGWVLVGVGLVLCTQK